MMKISSLREKEVINIKDGARLGLISDIDVDLEKGRVKGIILPTEGKILGFIGKNNDRIIKWNNIVKIGVDVILVDLTPDYDSYNEDIRKER